MDVSLKFQQYTFITGSQNNEENHPPNINLQPII